MKLISHLLLTATVILVTACGGASSGAAEMTGIMDDITAVLKDVKDAEGAKAAKFKIEPLMAKMNEFTKNAAKNASETPEKVDPEEVKKATASSTAYAAEMTRIMMAPALSAILTETLTSKMD